MEYNELIINILGYLSILGIGILLFLFILIIIKMDKDIKEMNKSSRKNMSNYLKTTSKYNIKT